MTSKEFVFHDIYNKIEWKIIEKSGKTTTELFH
jgi:hypothetical protein